MVIYLYKSIFILLWKEIRLKKLFKERNLDIEIYPKQSGKQTIVYYLKIDIPLLQYYKGKNTIIYNPSYEYFLYYFKGLKIYKI
jgi:hypothetical protein